MSEHPPAAAPSNLSFSLDVSSNPLLGLACFLVFLEG